MLPPAGKSQAASIWSFDSGYGSNSLEDEDNFHTGYRASSSTYKTPSSLSSLGYVGISNAQSDGGLRLRISGSLVEPVITKLNVFTTQTSINTDLLDTTHRDSHEGCITCQLWNIANPGEGLKCSDCSGDAFLAPHVISREDEQPKSKITVPDTPSVPQPEYLPQKLGDSRCSACEIAMWIDPYHASTCFSCSPNARFPSLEIPTHTGKAKRSSARRPPSKLESHALRCLKGWLRDNRKNPYPDADTKRSLAQQCGITEKQINTWFTNARARGKFFCRGTSDSASEDEGTPIFRRTSTAPAAKSNDSMSPATQQHDYSHANTSHSTSSSHSQESSVSSTSRKGKKKDYGQLGLQSYTSHHALHVQPKPVSSTAIGNGNGSETWQCTFCYQHIAHKSWRRHEETQHRPKRKWTCLLTGPSLQIVSHPANSTYCVFCKVLDPSEEHFLLSHRISECTEKSEGERTFLRPDHLRQHVKNFHKAPLDETVRDLWRKCETGNETTENWICGFCGHELRTWNARETHIARHFKDGLTMADWKDHDGLGGGTDTGKKRPTSSEGRPNTSPKVARMRTSLPVRQQHQHELDIMMANGLDSSPAVIDTHAIVAPSTPDAAFDCFIPQVWDQKYADTSGMGFNDQGNALDSGYDSALPDLNTGDFDFEGLLDLSECWLS